MMSEPICSCADFEDLELHRPCISRRIRETRGLKKRLTFVCKHVVVEHRLYRCETCRQLWQGSLAWNWGNDEYLFRIPAVTPEEWLEEFFVQPDELLIFSALVEDFLAADFLKEREEPCESPGCVKKAATILSMCPRHHYETLQKWGTKPGYPQGRWFPPYFRENFSPDW